MYRIKVKASFSSAHNLRGYKGKCEDLHGHNWKVEADIESYDLDKIGMIVDFSVLKKKLRKILEKLDHKYLNNIPYFKKINPTSENIAKYIYNRLKDAKVNPASVTVWESDTSCATYSE
jgi:6-pyruvoyltetrahydropterin/6-carboxytetrahydropterin synthase